MDVTDYGLCPVCREPTDNGHSRELPPTAYVCSGCASGSGLKLGVSAYTEGVQANGGSAVTRIVAALPDANVPMMIPSNWPAPDYDIVGYVKRCWEPDHSDLKQNESGAQEWGYRLVHNQEELRKLRATIGRLEEAYKERESAVMDAWSEYQGEKDEDV